MTFLQYGLEGVEWHYMYFYTPNELLTVVIKVNDRERKKIHTSGAGMEQALGRSMPSMIVRPKSMM